MITITVSSYSFPDNVPITLASLRKALSGISVSVSGGVASGDIAAGAVNPTHVAQGAYFYGGIASFASSTYTFSMSPVLGAYANGVLARFKAGADCGDGPINVNVNGLGSKVLQKLGGVDLVAGDIRNNQIVEMVYDSSLASDTGGWLITGDLGNPWEFFGTAGGTANAQTLTCSIPARSLAALNGRRVLYVATTENTGATTLAVDGLTAKAILKEDQQALVQGDIKVNDIVELVYSSAANSGAGAFLMQRARNLTFSGVDAGASDAYAVTIASFPGAYLTGLRVAFKAATANTGAATLNVNSLGAITLKKFSGKDLDTNDILAGQWVSCVYDGTNFQVQSTGDMIASAEQALRATAGITNIAHGLGARPRRVRWVLVAQSTTDHNYATGDEVDVFMAANTTNENRSLVPVTDATNVSLLQGCADAAVTIIDKSTPNVAAYTAVTPANWKVKCYYAP